MPMRWLGGIVMIVKRVVTIAVLTGALLPSAAKAQDRDLIEVSVLAVEAVTPNYGEQFEGRIVKADLGSIADMASRAAVGDRLTLAQAAKQSVLSCAGPSPKSCTLSGTDFLITLERVLIGEGRAEITVEVSGDQGSDRQPVWSAWWHVALSMRNGEWAVDEVRLGAQT